jgi:endoglucanase
MKNILFFLFVLFLFSAAIGQPVKVHGKLKVTGTQLTDEHGHPVVLNGMSFGWSCFHPRFYTAGAVKELHQQWNCNVVRAAMGVEPDGGYLKNPAASVNLVCKVVDAAVAEGIYVIIDWHSHNINLNDAKVFFKQMATEYHSYPNVIYEIFNEPDYETWAEVKAYSTEVIRVIRDIDSSNIILVGSPRWDQDIHLPAADPIQGFSNLMYTVHFYAGTHRQWLRDRTDSALARGLPVFISESAGMTATGDGIIDEEEWAKYINWMEKKKLSWITWSVSDKDETCSVLNKSASSDGGWTDKDLKQSGLLTKKYLLNKQQ